MNTLNHLSFSSISSFRNCQLGWWTKYIGGEEQPTTGAAQRGNDTDKLIAHRLGCGTDPREAGPLAERVEEAAEHYLGNGGWTRADEAQHKIELTPNQWDIYRDIYGVDWLLPLPIVGYIDLLRVADNGMQTEIADIKTSERAEYRADWSLQCALYALVTRAAKFEVHLLTYTKVIKLVRYEYRPTPETFRWAMNVIGSAANQIMEVARTKAVERIPATSGFWCSWCGRNLHCEAALTGKLTGVNV